MAKTMTFKPFHKEAITMYNEGSTTKEIAEHVGVTGRYIRDVLKYYGITLRGKRRTGGHRVNEDFLKTWSDDMAYVLGFILTDGCVSGNTVTIAQKDTDILYKIREAMSATNPIKKNIHNGNEIHTLGVHRKEIVEDLSELGITEKKSLSVGLPNVPDEYMGAFVRGVVDGDGWVHAKGYTMVITSGSLLFSEAICEVLVDRGLNARVKKETDKINRVIVSGKQDIVNMSEWLYENKSTLYMQRKYDRFTVNVA